MGFEKVFNHKPQVKESANARVNLIGEHTDYNGGYVFPCALDLTIDLFFEKKSNESYVNTDLGYSMSFDTNTAYKKSNNHWLRFWWISGCIKVAS